MIIIIKMNNFKSFIKNNFAIIKTLFYINEKDVEIIDDDNRLITKKYNLNHLYKYLPFVEAFVPNLTTINIIISENYNDNNNIFTYKIYFEIIDVEAYIFLSQNKNKININIDTNNKTDIIHNLIIEFYKNNHLENQLKPLISNLSHHSLALNII
jgi:hypothetical protein